VKALTVVRPNQVELQERPDLTAGPGEVLIQPVVVGICGTDLDIIEGTIDPAFVQYPVVIGHEWAGTVVSSNASEFKTGDRVVVEGVVPCGTCEECQRGATNRCAIYDEFGFTRNGAAADLLVAPGTQVHRLADTVSWESAALVEPAAVVYRALTTANMRPGARVLVVGDGTVGLLAATLVRTFDPSSVTVLGARDQQQRLVALTGADDFTTNADSVGANYDVVIEAAGAVTATAKALVSAARGGTIVLLGFPGQGQSVPLHVDDVVNNDLTIVGSFSYTTKAWADVVRVLNEGKADLGWLVTHRFPLDDFAEGLKAIRQGSDTERGKVLLVP